MSESAVWIAWGIPARGRERQALDLLKHSVMEYLEQLSREGRIERFDAVLLKPQSTELAASSSSRALKSRSTHSAPTAAFRPG